MGENTPQDNTPQENTPQENESSPDGSAGRTEDQGSEEAVSFAQILQRIKEQGKETRTLQWADEFEEGVYFLSFAAEMPPFMDGAYHAHIHVRDPAGGGDEEDVEDNVIDLRVYKGGLTRETGGVHTTIQYLPKPYADRLRKNYQEEVVDPVVAACPEGVNVQTGLPALTYREACDAAGIGMDHPVLKALHSNGASAGREERGYPVYTGVSGKEDQRRREQCQVFHLCEVCHDVDPTSEDGIETVLIDARSRSAAEALHRSGACSEFYSIAAPSFVEAKERFGRVAAIEFYEGFGGRTGIIGEGAF